jgi:uncharacterized protein
MSYWDSSALLPLCIEEPASPLIRNTFQRVTRPVVWWGALFECQSALERLHRSGDLVHDQKRRAQGMLSLLASGWREVLPTNSVRERALRILSSYRLASADSLQLAAAVVWCEDQPEGRKFVCLDDRLRDCAAREGFVVLPDTSV